VATDYEIENACQIDYSILTAANAATYGVSLSRDTISVITSTQSLIGTSISLYLLGQYTTISNPLNQSVEFFVEIMDPCTLT
jgi:hypothetical protein